ncbi:type VII secretion-associated serine protease mycosin [Nocardia jinanensis]|uniref:Type VII secretion-associated serine protease n=1 Tax=Nocardia jinanensis TaxID=382504 RepID=A0A917RVX0_9NOCA|nr:type VII secretion-associated serine protease mycosin [Nocardia jinanensis]GGL40652.1 type VII secretion-associated serine protease [Nocardia jinanensis]
MGLCLSRAAAAALTALVLGATAAPAGALVPPEVVVGVAPPDGPPAPEVPTKQESGCLATGVLQDTDISRTPPSELALNLADARTLSRGLGVTVAVVDTGVTPHPRLPNVTAGGDYVAAGGDGLQDCDAHGTLIAGIIGGAADPADGFTGVAPDARILSIRYRSAAFRVERGMGDQRERLALEIRTLSRAITHAANLGAGIIAVPLPVCLAVDSGVDLGVLAEAIGYAVHTRGSLIVAGAGNSGSMGCEQNPGFDPGRPGDPRNWKYVKTAAAPGVFAESVLTVGYTTAYGGVTDTSLMGPWVTVAAPGTGIESLGPGSVGLINGVGPPDKLVPVGGSSFAAAYTAGVAALVRSRYPNETPAEIVARLTASAHAPARGIDNTVGAGVIDPVAALSYRTPPEPPEGLFQVVDLELPPPPRSPDARPGITAAIVIVAAVLIGAAATYGVSSRRRQQR